MTNTHGMQTESKAHFDKYTAQDLIELIDYMCANNAFTFTLMQSSSTVSPKH